MAAPIYHDPLVEQILAVHAEFEPPEGHKAEVIEGNIVVSPTPSRHHGKTHSKLHRQLHTLLLDPADAELVAEIVSPSNSRNDRVVKLRGYEASGVPIYLLIDPLEESATLFFEPSDGTYQQVRRVPFGTSIALPPPYSGKLDTGAFISRATSPGGTSDI
jgi:Uma2 family endonuclease